MHPRPARSVPTLLALAALLLGCPPERQDDPPTAVDSRLFRFTSCGELRDSVVDAFLESLVSAHYGDRWALPMDSADGGGGEGPSAWSETNVQEAGVDEPDLVKTDGEFMYIAQREELTILRTWPPADTARVASLPLDGAPFSLFLHGDLAAVFSYDYSRPGGDVGDGWDEGYATRITMIDVSDREEPRIVRQIDLEGWFVDARLLGADLYVVLSTWTEIPAALWDALWTAAPVLPTLPPNPTEAQAARARGEARVLLRPLVQSTVDGLRTDELIPRMLDRRTPNGDAGSQTLLACTDVFRPEGISHPAVLSVVHVDLDVGEAGSQVEATGLMAEGWEVYASQESLYVAQSSRWWWWGWGALDLSTHVHRFELAGGDTSYQSSGSVDGWLLNSFSMSEWDGHLRMATTDTDAWWGTTDEAVDPPANNVFCLREAGAELEVVGEIRGIAPDEQIQAARFLGPRGFLVTYRFIDPLFTIDLQDPTDPRLVGELELPGWSAYLHPLGGDHLLGVGMDATLEGQVLGLAVNLFDVSDFSSPAVVDRFTLQSDDWSWSEALWDHHAFTLWEGVLALPVYTWAGDEGFSGLLLLSVDEEEGLEERGRIDHTDIVADSECLWGSSWDNESWGGPCDDLYWYASMRRSVGIEGWIYSLSDYGLKVNSLQDPTQEAARVVFWPRQGS